MPDLQSRTLQALVEMCTQYLQTADDELLDTLCMTAGERAIEVLAEEGLVEIDDGQTRFARWTLNGLAMRDAVL